MAYYGLLCFELLRYLFYNVKFNSKNFKWKFQPQVFQLMWFPLNLNLLLRWSVNLQEVRNHCQHLQSQYIIAYYYHTTFNPRNIRIRLGICITIGHLKPHTKALNIFCHKLSNIPALQKFIEFLRLLNHLSFNSWAAILFLPFREVIIWISYYFHSITINWTVIAIKWRSFHKWSPRDYNNHLPRFFLICFYSTAVAAELSKRGSRKTRSWNHQSKKKQKRFWSTAPHLSLLHPMPYPDPLGALLLMVIIVSKSSGKR